MGFRANTALVQANTTLGRLRLRVAHAPESRPNFTSTILASTSRSMVSPIGPSISLPHCGFLPVIWRIFRRLTLRPSTSAPAPTPTFADYTSYPSSLPPCPQVILANRPAYEEALSRRRFLPHPGPEDTPLFTLYRLYENIVLDRNNGLRNEIEYFWRKRSWAVNDIPDPKDDDAARYAILACITHLLVEAFNRNIGLGLPRDAPAMMTNDMLDEMRTREKKYERVPGWVMEVPPLAETLRLPHHRRIDEDEFDVIEDIDDERASTPFKEKNVLIWKPHIMFI